MKFSDFVPIIVAALSFVGVMLVPLLGGNRPRNQLEAIKTVREVLATTDDNEVKKALRSAERHLAARIEVRYRPLSEKWNTTYTTIAVIVAASVLAVLVGTLLAVGGQSAVSNLTVGAAVIGALASSVGLLLRAFMSRRELIETEIEIRAIHDKSKATNRAAEKLEEEIRRRSGQHPPRD